MSYDFYYLKQYHKRLFRYLHIIIVIMYYKLSNTAGRDRIERLFKVSFKYPKLYEPQVLIHGADEANLNIITSKSKQEVSQAIWGMLPEGYQDDWEVFQDLTNTLNIDEKDLDSDLWYSSAMRKRRCLIIVTGFFTTLLKNGETYPYHIGLENENPFFLAGTYNVLDDGFITCSILVGKANSYIKKFQNMVDTMPLVISSESKDLWLDTTANFHEIIDIPHAPNTMKFCAKSIEKEFFKQNISYDSMLVSHSYPNLPVDS